MNYNILPQNLPKEWEVLLNTSNISKEETKKNPEVCVKLQNITLSAWIVVSVSVSVSVPVSVCVYTTVPTYIVGYMTTYHHDLYVCKLVLLLRHVMKVTLSHIRSPPLTHTLTPPFSSTSTLAQVGTTQLYCDGADNGLRSCNQLGCH